MHPGECSRAFKNDCHVTRVLQRPIVVDEQRSDKIIPARCGPIIGELTFSVDGATIRFEEPSVIYRRHRGVERPPTPDSSQ